VFWPGAFLYEERGIAKDIDRILESNIVLGSVDAIIFFGSHSNPIRVHASYGTDFQ